MARVTAMLMDPGPFLTFIQNDSCPNNIVHAPHGWRLLDFEGARFAHALLEGVYGLMPFPSCWCMCRIPDQVARRMQSAYRDELTRGCPAAADDDLYYPAVVAACVYWMFSIPRFAPLADMLKRDRTVATLSVRQRYLLLFENLANILERHGLFRSLSEMVHEMSEKLHELWPEARDIPCYPALRRRKP